MLDAEESMQFSQTAPNQNVKSITKTVTQTTEYNIIDAPGKQTHQ